MRTQKQIEASRLNGAKSRGPVTEEGKATSSRNAITHGALAYIIVEGEDESKLIDSYHRLVREHEPETDSDFDMLEAMVTALWQQRRMREFVSACLTDEIRTQVDAAPHLAGKTPKERGGRGWKNAMDSSKAVEHAMRYEARYERQYFRYVKHFRALKKERQNDDRDFVQNEPEVDLIALYSTLPETRSETGDSVCPPASEPKADSPAIRWNLPQAPPDILARIVSRKREELQYVATPLADLRRVADQPRRDFAAALRATHPAIISEIKKASPSKGILIDDFRPADLARQYQQGGAAALSVLTDRDFFHGSLPDLRAARQACTLPVLRKDFTIAEYHVIEAAAAGADAILLIAAILDDAELKSFRELADTYNMATLVEAHDEHELERALKSGAKIVGVNNRDLRTFQVNLDVSINLASRIPNEVIKVSESGIYTNDDIQRLTAAGYQAFLIGESLIKSQNPTQALTDLLTPFRDGILKCS